MNNLLQRVIKLIEKTGDRMVVFDKEGKNAYVIMNIHSYESLLGGKSEQFEPDSNISDDYQPESPNWSSSNQPSPLDPAAISHNSETEVIRGIETEVVNIAESPREPEEADEKNRYYFEEVDDELPASPAES